MSSSGLVLNAKLDELLSAKSFDVAAWAKRPLTSAVLDVLTHFLVTQTSNHTRQAYARDIIEFLQFCKSINTPIQRIDDIKEKHILFWKDNLIQKHARFEESRRRVASSSVARKLCTLSSFCEFSIKRKLIEDNPLKLITRPRVRRQSHATVLNDTELKLVLNHSRRRLEDSLSQLSNSTEDGKDNHRKARVEWCILVMLFTIGMRVSELCQMKMNDVIWEGDLIRLHLLAKGGRQHNPLIHPESASVLLEYIRVMRAGALPDSPLFPAARKSADSNSITHIHRSTVFRIVREAAARAGVTRSFSPHGCRATLATQLHLNEVPVVEIQGLLNHAQVTTTQLYLHRVDELKESAALKLPWTQSNKLKPSRRA